MDILKFLGETMKKLFCIDNEICDWHICFLWMELYIWKPDPWIDGGYNLKDWGIGRFSDLDGCLAIRTPWFLLYLE
jgi:hypothetical protein